MALESLNEEQMKNVRPLKDITPVREISLVTRRNYLRERILDIIISEVKDVVPASYLNPDLKKYTIDF